MRAASSWAQAAGEAPDAVAWDDWYHGRAKRCLLHSWEWEIRASDGRVRMHGWSVSVGMFGSVYGHCWFVHLAW